MKSGKFIRRAGFAIALLVASFVIVPSAFARVHVGVGISVPGLSIGVGNCWRCGYGYVAPPPPVYYQPAYAAPAYYPAPVYYAPRPVYYGYSYYGAPYYYGRGYHRGYDRHDRDDYHHGGGGYYHHRHH